mmetsp:Transcript_8104/g.21439  ORF Transcript_8104/g.21439 Transcript_8104/m.21439 type:complete len:121 (+) Transcript_8104:3402-3764(+)
MTLPSFAADHRLSLGHTSSFGEVTDGRWHRMRIRYFPIRSLTAFDGSAEKATWRSTEYGGLLVQMYGSAEGTFLLQVRPPTLNRRGRECAKLHGVGIFGRFVHPCLDRAGRHQCTHRTSK